MSRTDIDAIIERLGRIDPARPRFDPAAVRRALDRHADALRLPPFEIRWMPDLSSAVLAATGEAWNPRWCVAEAHAWSAAWEALGAARFGESRSGLTTIEPAGRRAAREAAWRQADDLAVRMSSLEGARNPLRPTWDGGDRGRAFRDDGAAEARATAREPWRMPTLELFTAASAVEEAVAWIAAAARTPDEPSVHRMAEVWRPLVDACEAGLWMWFVLSDTVFAVPRPEVHVRNGRLHRADGPALAWPGGTRRWFWNGVEVPRHVVEEPQRLTVRQVREERNVEVRRVMLERYGAERLLRDLEARPVHADDFGTLYRVDVPGDEPLALVRVVNATPEPDGSRKLYFLRVPPSMRTARQAVAWTFGLTEAQYLPRIET